MLKRLMRDESGQGMAEYGLILSVVAIAALIALTGLGSKIKEIFTNLTNDFEGKTTTP